MTPFVLGSRGDVAGFGLAGVAGVICATHEDIEAALSRIGTDVLVIVSARLAPLLPATMPVMFVVLPEA